MTNRNDKPDDITKSPRWKRIEQAFADLNRRVDACNELTDATGRSPWCAHCRCGLIACRCREA